MKNCTAYIKTFSIKYHNKAVANSLHSKKAVCFGAIVTACNTVRYIGTKTYNDYAVSSGQIWLDNVHCNGTERDIDECTHNAWGVHNCEHHDDVAISCTTGWSRFSSVVLLTVE